MKSTSTCMMIVALAVGACSTAPKSSGEKQDLAKEAQMTLMSMRNKEPTLAYTLQNAAGYAVFPSIGKAGFVAGAAYGRGMLYEGGRPSGYVELNQASFGAQIGAESFSELIIFQNPQDVQNLKVGTFKLGASAGVVVLKTGAGRGAVFKDGVAVIIDAKTGAMADISVSGQKINFRPMGT